MYMVILLRGSVFEIRRRKKHIWIKLNQPSIGPVIDFDYIAINVSFKVTGMV